MRSRWERMQHGERSYKFGIFYAPHSTGAHL
jgi:hypothetical protein